MSLLKSIKGTFQSVQQDLSIGIRSLTVASSDVSKIASKDSTGGVANYDAGADLLHKHELIWRDLFHKTAETASKAEDVDAKIGALFVYYDRQCEIIARLHSEAANLPVLLGQLQEVTDSLAQVEEEYDKVESALLHLENTCEEQEQHRYTLAHQAQLDTYRGKKAQELDRMKIQLARDHTSKLDQRNKQRQSLLKERQSAYEDQFSQDVDYYKKHGKSGRLEITPESQRKLDIAEIQVAEDEDVKALDEFLAASETDVTVSEPGDTEALKDNVEAETKHPEAAVEPDMQNMSQVDKINTNQNKTEITMSEEQETNTSMSEAHERKASTDEEQERKTGMDEEQGMTTNTNEEEIKTSMNEEQERKASTGEEQEIKTGADDDQERKTSTADEETKTNTSEEQERKTGMNEEQGMTTNINEEEIKTSMNEEQERKASTGEEQEIKTGTDDDQERKTSTVDEETKTNTSEEQDEN